MSTARRTTRRRPVDADGSQLVLGARVSVCASDRNELVADVDAIPLALGAADRVLADSGYATGSEVSQLEGRAWKCWWRRGRKANGASTTSDRSRGADGEGAAGGLDQVDAAEDGTAGAPGALPFAQADGGAGVRDREAGDGLPAVFCCGVSRKVEGEWALVTLAYNCRRLHNLRLA